jgi:hypothetical protein
MKTPSCSKIIVSLCALLIFCGALPVLSSAATFVVSNTGDNGGVNPAPNAGTGTLRQAIVDANANGGPGPDIITFNTGVTGTILLASALPNLADDVTINGPGANVLSVDGNNASRVFDIASGKTVTISGLTITGGIAPNNFGGAIYNDHATLTVTNCTLSSNSAADGGGIYNDGASSGSAMLTVTNCTLSDNSANNGGGIFSDGSSSGSATLTVTNCTLSGNSANMAGGGIYNDGSSSGSATLTVTNCTLSGNSANMAGGGIYNDGESSGSATLTLGDTILKAGASGANILNDSGTVTSQGYNLSSDAGVTNVSGGTGALNATGDQTNTDPMLDPNGLHDNGGPTLTIALLPNSPAVDKGKNFSGSPNDQRGPGFARTFGTALVAGGDGTDIGAFEVQPPVLSATINDTVTGTGLNQFDYGVSGWFYYNGPTIPTAYQEDEHYAYMTNVVAHFRFHGTQVKIYTVKEPHGGIIGYNLDGMGETTMSNYAPTIMGNMLSYTSPVVADGDHDLVIRVTGMHEMASDANAITVDKAEVYVPAGTPQVLSATVNDTVTGNGPNQWDYQAGNWFYYNGANISSAYQGDEHYAYTTGVLAHFRFSGTQVKIFTVKEPHGGIIGYNLDGMGETTVSNYAPTIMGNMLSYTSPVVPDGIHDLVIRVTGTHEGASDGNAITVDKAEVFAPPPQTLTATINDNTTGTGDGQWDYGMGGNWFYYNGANISSAYQGDEHYAFTTNVTGTFRFTGTQVKIYTVKESAGGNIGYTLDANPEVILSNYSPMIMGNTLSFVSPVVANGPHTLVIRVVGTHEAASSGNAITVDKAEVYGP